MSVRIEHGDCREVIKSLADCSVDSCVTDPPYSLISIQKRFGKPGSAAVRVGDINATSDLKAAYARQSRGFMGKQWDTGETAHDPAFWAEVSRVMKPGAHLVAFAGTRTYHRMVCAIEDAGFEIRDQIGWCFGSGFPKSHDVSKGIDRRGGASIAWFGPWLRAERERRGITQKSLALHFPSKTGGLTGCVANWELGLNLPTPEQFNSLCRILSLSFERIEEAEREVIGNNDRPAGWFTSQDGHDITKAASPAARQWEGWGTALKPAWEPICLARKPFKGTVSANVLQHGTGAINIDACRIETDWESDPTRRGWQGRHLSHDGGAVSFVDHHKELSQPNDKGRWPANVVHDGSDEVAAAFPESNGGAWPADHAQFGYSGGERKQTGVQIDMHEPGSAARFFYAAKADSDERCDSKHPTVKPVSLMRWLARLVTPPGGTVLDPFAGSGTTGVACIRESFSAILIEREAEYVADIRRRLARLGGADTPLFGSEVA